MTAASGTKRSATAAAAPTAARRAGGPLADLLARRYPIAVVGAVAVVLGVVAQVVALLALTWWQGTVHGRQVTMQFADFGPRTWRGFAFMYFSWGAWLIAVLTLGLGITGCVRWRGALAFRIAGAVFAVLAAFAPIAALLVFAYQSGLGHVPRRARLRGRSLHRGARHDGHRVRCGSGLGPRARGTDLRGGIVHSPSARPQPAVPRPAPPLGEVGSSQPDGPDHERGTTR